MQDEPVLGLEFDAPLGEELSDRTVVECIQTLVAEEPFAVLCTQGGGQPYGSVVAFAFSHDLTSFVFATPRATRKFRLLSRCDRVALVVDNRGRFPEDLMKVGAVTITGKAQQLELGPEFEGWARLLTERHPYLKSFVDAPSTALFRVDVVRFLHVTRFQEVRQWIPPSDGQSPLQRLLNVTSGSSAARRPNWPNSHRPDSACPTASWSRRKPTSSL